jgi:tetratricopeptide (TPR) repeat protein
MPLASTDRRIYRPSRLRRSLPWLFFGPLLLVLGSLASYEREAAGVLFGVFGGLLLIALVLQWAVGRVRLELSPAGVKLSDLGGGLETPWSNVIGVRLDRGREGFITREPLLGRGASRLASVRGLAYYGEPAYDEQQRQLMGERRVIPIDVFGSHLRYGPLIADIVRFAPWLQADCAAGPRPALRKPPVPLRYTLLGMGLGLLLIVGLFAAMVDERIWAVVFPVLLVMSALWQIYSARNCYLNGARLLAAIYAAGALIFGLFGLAGIGMVIEGRGPKDRAVSCTGRGLALYARKDHDGAIAEFNEAIRLDPANVTAYRARGNVWDDKKEFARALADYDQALRIDPDDFETYRERGRAWYTQGQYANAIADYGEAIRRNLKDATSYRLRGQAWHLQDDDDKAIADFSEAIRRHPRDVVSYRERGNAWDNKRDFGRAMADYDQALKIDPRDFATFRERAIARYTWGDYAGALADVGEALRLDPGDVRALQQQARIRATCPDARYRDGPLAVKAATLACERAGSKDARRLGTLAAAHAESGDFESAVKWQEAALALIEPGKDREAARARLDLYRAKQPYHDPPRRP